MRTGAADRRLTLSRAAVLIAALGVGMALVRPAAKMLADRPMQFSNKVESVVFYGLLYTTPLILTCSMVTLASALLRPRPPLRRLARWPGFVANAAGILGVLASLLPYITPARNKIKY